MWGNVATLWGWESPRTGRMVLPFEEAAEPAIKFTPPAGKAGEVGEEPLP